MDRTPLIDTHCHLDMTIDGSLPDPLRTLLNAALNGVTSVIQISVDAAGSHWNKKLSETYKKDLLNYIDKNGGQLQGSSDRDELVKKAEEFSYFWTAGLHPETASFSGHKDIKAAFQIIKESRDLQSFAAIGETGLDYFHSPHTAGIQKEVFEEHLKIAADLDLPVILHLRDDRAYNPEKTHAVKDALTLVNKYRIRKGVLHCFTYGYDEAMPFVEKGWMVSFSGIITYKNTDVIQNAVRRLPEECLLIETDAPFLAPVPHRGKPNEPAYLAHIFNTIAALRFSEDYRPADNKNSPRYEELQSQGLIEEQNRLKKIIYKNSIKLTGWKNHA